MAREVFPFTHKRQAGAAGAFEFRVRKAQFGDGYSQRVPDGLNARSQSWPLAFEGGLDEMLEIKSFLDRHDGATSFDWTPPGGALGTYVAETYKFVSVGAGLYSVTTDFEQVFTP